MSSFVSAPQFLDTKPDARQGALVVVLVVVLHMAAGWGLLQLDVVRTALAESAPLLVTWVSPEIPKPAEPPKPVPKPVKRREPPPLVTTPAPLPQVAPVFEAAPAPAPQPEPPPMAAVNPVPAPPPPAVAPPQPKNIPASAVLFRHEVKPRYLPISKKIGEHGRVVVRLLIDVNGKPLQAQVRESSGFDRLDREALTAALASLFHPYMENGQAVSGWALIPYDFSLE